MYFQLYLYIYIWLCLIASLWGAGPAYLILNEIGANYGLSSYIELFGSDGLSPEILATLYFGIVVLEPRERRGGTYVVAVFDLVELRQSTLPGTKYFVLGDPSAEQTTGAQNYFGSSVSTATPTSRTSKRIFATLEEWLEVKENKLKMVILTCSTQSSITSQIPTQLNLPSRQIKPVLEKDKDVSKLYDYVVSFQVDIVIMSGLKANRKSCAPLDKLYNEKYLKEGRLQPYKLVNEDNSGLGGKTYERCGLTNNPFNHLAFYGGEPSPGKFNPCSGGRWNLNSRSDDVVSTKPSSTDFDGTCYLSDNCQNGICTPDDHDVFYQVTGEQFESIIQDPDANQNNELTSVCGLMDEIRQDFASVSNMVKVGQAKRLKTWRNPESAICPGDPFLAMKRERERHIASAMIHIKKYQKDLFHEGDVLKYSSWFNYIFNPEKKETSTYNCYFCSKYSDHKDYQIQAEHKTALSVKEGVLMASAESNHNVLKHHRTTKTHMKIMQTYKEIELDEMKKKIQGDINQNEPIHYVVTNRHMRYVFTLCKRMIALYAYEDLAKTSKKSGMNLGNYCDDYDSAANMAYAISEMYEEETKELIMNSNALSLLTDGSDDRSMNHYASVMFQLLDQNKIVRVVFYKLVTLGVSSSGQAYFEAIKKELEDDGLYEHVSQHLVSISTDGAGNMGTFVDKMAQDMRRPEIFRQTCAAHKLELILETPLKRGLCVNCQKLDAILKKISAFYARSPKRTNSLRKFCNTNRKIFFRPRKILDIRWVSSHFYAGRHIYQNWATLVGHLNAIISGTDFTTKSSSDHNTREAARNLLLVLTQRNFLTTLAMQLDIQYTFKGVSELFQRKGESFLGQASKKHDLLAGMQLVRRDEGTFMLDLLRGSTYRIHQEGLGIVELAFNTVLQFEDGSAVVTWQNIRMLSAATIDPSQDSLIFNRISQVKNSYIEFIEREITTRFPDNEINQVSEHFDQSRWSLDIMKQFAKPEFKNALEEWPKIFELDYAEGTMTNGFEKIAQFLKANPDLWCSTHLSTATQFFSKLRQEFVDMPTDIANVIDKSLVVTSATADVER